MGKRIVWLCLLLVAIVGGYSYYKHHQDVLRLANGDVNCDGCMTPEEHERYLKENSSQAAGGQSDTAKTDRDDDSTGETTVSAAQIAVPASNSPGAAGSATVGTAAGPVAGAASKTAVKSAGAAAGGTSAGATEPAPSADTLAPNPPNGMVFAGKGTYQWYRQGNLTWRVDTVSGRSCIVYATMEEWRKQIVLSHGCGRSA